jgi:hypothetical protein
MLAQLIASEVQKAPDINQDVLAASKRLEAIPECQTLEQLFELSTIARTKYECLSSDRRTINLYNFESMLKSARHAVSAIEEDFFV